MLRLNIRKSHKLLAFLFTYCVVMLLTPQIFELGISDDFIALLSLFILVLMIVLWVALHADEHGLDLNPLMYCFLTILAPVALVFYFYRYFGFKAGSLRTLFALLFVCTIVIFSFLVDYFILGGQARGRP